MPARGRDYTVEGLRDLKVVSDRLLEVGDKGLKRQLATRLREANAGTLSAIKASAADRLPHRGGLAADVAGSKFTIRVWLSASAVSLRASATNLHQIRGMDRGRLRHPVFARSDQTREEWTWVGQAIKPGWFTDPVLRRRRQNIKATERAAADMQAIIDGRSV